MRAARALAALKANRGVVALCVAIFFSMVGSGAISPVLPAFAKDFGVGVLLVASTVALFGVARGVMALPSGYMAQRYGRRPVLVGGMALNTVGSLLMPFSKNITQLILYRAIAGFGSSMYAVGAAIYLRDVATKENRARYQSLNELSILVGVSIGPFLGGALAEAWGIRATLFLQAGLAGVAALIALAFITETKEMAQAKDKGVSSDNIPREMNTRSGLRYLLFNPSFIVVSLFNLMIVANRQGGRFTIIEIGWEKRTPKSDKIERRRCQYERCPSRKIHEGIPPGSSEAGNGREAIIAGGSPPVVPGAIDVRVLGEGTKGRQTGRCRQDVQALD